MKPTITEHEDGSFTIEWDAVPGATGYRISTDAVEALMDEDAPADDSGD